MLLILKSQKFRQNHLKTVKSTRNFPLEPVQYLAAAKQIQEVLAQSV